MTLDNSSLKYLIPTKFKIEASIPKQHPMIILARNVPWKQMSDFVVDDLYNNCNYSGPSNSWVNA